MDDGRWYWASIISCFVLGEENSRKLESWIGICLFVCSTMAATAGEINLISKWFAMIVCSARVEN